MKIRVEINKREIRPKIYFLKINETERWFFEKINKISKLLARLRKEREKIQVTMSEMKEVTSL